MIYVKLGRDSLMKKSTLFGGDKDKASKIPESTTTMLIMPLDIQSATYDTVGYREELYGRYITRNDLTQFTAKCDKLCFTMKNSWQRRRNFIFGGVAIWLLLLIAGIVSLSITSRPDGIVCIVLGFLAGFVLAGYGLINHNNTCAEIHKQLEGIIEEENQTRAESNTEFRLGRNSTWIEFRTRLGLRASDFFDSEFFSSVEEEEDSVEVQRDHLRIGSYQTEGDLSFLGNR
mmetsp:Transcript_13812/g.15278  ORF Transcript_13812/g.15278 Transcript_13812/m.15278 type:complete len:231 (+) Transcript_13812:217-909(+)